jgi:ketosteroid isomerase-like protein
MTNTVKKAYTPEDAHKLWVQYGQEKDLEALLSLYEPAGSIYDVGKKEVIATEDARRRFLREFLDTVSEFNLYTASVTMSGDGTLALLRSKWYAKSLSNKDSEDRSEWSVENCGAEVVRKQPDDGNWLFIIDNPYAATSWDSFPEY